MPYQLTPMPPRQDNQDFLTSFMSTFLPAAQQMLMYKYQKSMEEDSWQKRQRMEQAWKLEQMKAEQALKEQDPDYLLKRDKLSVLQGLTPEQRNKAALIDLGLEAKPEAPSFLEQKVFGSGGMDFSGLGNSQDALPVTQIKRDLISGMKGGSPDLAKTLVPPSEAEVQAQVDARDKWADTVYGAKRNARLSGALNVADPEKTGNNLLDSENKKLQGFLGALAGAGAGVTGRGMDQLTSAAMGETTEPGFIQTRKNWWEQDKKVRGEAEDEARKTAREKEKDARMARLISEKEKIPYDDALYQVTTGRGRGAGKPNTRLVLTGSQMVERGANLLRDLATALPDLPTKFTFNMLSNKNDRKVVDLENVVTPKAKAALAKVTEAMRDQVLDYYATLIDGGWDTVTAQKMADDYENKIQDALGVPFPKGK